MAKQFEHFFRRCTDLASGCQFREQPSEADWKRVEREIGRPIPVDHQRFVSHFGSGSVGDDLYVLNPSAVGRCRLDLNRLETYANERRILLEDAKCKVYPQTELMVVAFTTSRMDVLLDLRDAEGESLLFLDLGMLQQYPLRMSFAEFVCRLYMRELGAEWEPVRGSIWGDDAPFFKPFTTP